MDSYTGSKAQKPATMRQIIFLFLFANQLVGQTNLTLQSAVNQAVVKNGAVKKAQLDVTLLGLRVEMEKSAGLPQISGRFSLDYAPLLPTTLLPGEPIGKVERVIPVRFGQPFQSLAQVDVHQVVYKAGVKNTVSAQDLAETMTQALVDKSKDEVAYQVAQLYLQMKQTQALQATIAMQKVRLSALHTAVSASVEQGYAIKTDLSRVVLVQQQLAAQEQELYIGIQYQSDLLGFLIQAKSDTSVLLVTDSLLIRSDLETMPTPDLRAIDNGIGLQKAQIKIAAAEKHPTLNAYASAGLQGNQARFVTGLPRFYGLGVLGVRAHIPIYDGKRLSYRLKMLQIEVQKNELDRDRLLDAQEIEVRNAQRGVMLSQQQIRLAEQSVLLSKDVFDAMRSQYQAGNQALKELLDVQAALSTAETELASKKIGLMSAQIKLLKVSGKLDQLWKGE
jgi:outer membrane protein